MMMKELSNVETRTKVYHDVTNAPDGSLLEFSDGSDDGALVLLGGLCVGALVGMVVGSLI